MEDVTKVNINMIKNMDLEPFIGLMAENMLVIGKMENNMEEVNTIYQMDRKKLDNGYKVKKLNGLNNPLQIKLPD
jgi:hypothetical protein